MQVVRTFQPGDEEAFRTLNEAWITKYFRLEDKDRETLEDPQSHILSPGGQIFMAVRNGQPIGCCGLIALKDGSMEVAKMAVAEASVAKASVENCSTMPSTTRGRTLSRGFTSKPIAHSQMRSISTNRPASSVFPPRESNYLRMHAPTCIWK